MRKIIFRFSSWIRKIKHYISLFFEEKPVKPWSVIKHSAGAAVCYLLYEASIADYFEMRFFEKLHRVRKTYFTSNQARRFIYRVNGAENTRRFHDKIYMYRTLAPFTKREQLFCPPESYQEFENFIQKHRAVLYKNNHTYSGTGIELWSIDNSSLPELYEKSLEHSAVLDELVIQHPDIARFHPDSINTVKIYTFMIQNDCHFIAAEFRMGRKESFVDNIESGGLAACVDLATGTIVGFAYDLQGNEYSVHPDTKVEIAGYKLPNWEEVLRFAEECARACPLAYVEWDLAIREKDCVLIEANPNARNCGIQMGVFQGRKKQFQELENLFVQMSAQ
ncbi:MAG: hypothetical protein J5483_06840 [Lachnospiraceae bacterium]|nr:hypothetical protein [Lachnospiraceae bacterium]